MNYGLQVFVVAFAEFSMSAVAVWCRHQFTAVAVDWLRCTDGRWSFWVCVGVRTSKVALCWPPVSCWIRDWHFAFHAAFIDQIISCHSQNLLSSCLSSYFDRPLFYEWDSLNHTEVLQNEMVLRFIPQIWLCCLFMLDQFYGNNNECHRFISST